MGYGRIIFRLEFQFSMDELRQLLKTQRGWATNTKFFIFFENDTVYVGITFKILRRILLYRMFGIPAQIFVISCTGL